MTSRITKNIIVKQDLEQVYKLWSDFQYFPNFMKYVKEVTKEGEKKSRWQVVGPLGKTITWQAEMTRQEPNKRIAWNSKDQSGTITTSGQVTFNNLPGNQTEVTVTMNYTPPAGKVGNVLTHLFANPEKQVEEDLRHFKQFAEGMYNRTWAK